MANDATTNGGGTSRGDGAARRRAAIQAAAVTSKKNRRAATPRARTQPAAPGRTNGVGTGPGPTAAADVFIAYAHSDGASVAQLVDDLRQTGISVAWDRDILAGRQFRKDIQSAIRDAAAAIVVWSDAAVDSHFVMDEADLALTQN
ncbi:MAG: toll/interleukin-1 receptor domain-containing protein, partial [Hyphomicrobiaceae bacterium]